MYDKTYFKFNDPEDYMQIIEFIIKGNQETRWKPARILNRIEDPIKRSDALSTLENLIQNEDLSFETINRLKLAISLLEKPQPINNTIIVRGKGAFTRDEYEACGMDIDRLVYPRNFSGYYPVIDFHVHPKEPDSIFMSDMYHAGVSNAVILATDTDPEDIDREEIREKLGQSYQSTKKFYQMSFEDILENIRSSLYSYSHVSNQDVADWVEDYPDQLIGFGSVNLSKPRYYVEETLNKIAGYGLRGIKLLPFSQFFNPSTNENIDLLMPFCQKNKLIVLSHTGCAAGVFENPYFSKDSRPLLWDKVMSRYPDVTLVLAHFGSYSSLHPTIWFGEAIELMSRHENVYADLAAVFYLWSEEGFLKRIRSTIGFDRVLYGGDYPMPRLHQDGAVGVIDSLKNCLWLTEDEKHKILGENAGKLLRII